MSADESSAPADLGSLPSPEVRSAISAVLANCEISEVRPTHILATFEEGGRPGDEIDAVAVNVGSANAWGRGALSNRLEFRIQVLGPDERPVARFEFDLVVDYEVQPDFEPDPRAIDWVAATTGYFAAFPYARELLQSLTARLRLDPLVLGFLRRGGGGTMTAPTVARVAAVRVGHAQQ